MLNPKKIQYLLIQPHASLFHQISWQLIESTVSLHNPVNYRQQQNKQQIQSKLCCGGDKKYIP